MIVGRKRRIDWNKVKALILEGKSVCQIACDLDASQRYISKICKKMNVKSQHFNPFGNRDITIPRKRKILRLYKQKKPIEEIALEVNLSYKQVSVIIGHHLMRLCRQEPKCPMKALLPEAKE